MRADSLLAILGMALVTYAARAGGLWLMGRINLSPEVERWLRHLPRRGPRRARRTCGAVGRGGWTLRRNRNGIRRRAHGKFTVGDGGRRRLSLVIKNNWLRRSVVDDRENLAGSHAGGEGRPVP